MSSVNGQRLVRIFEVAGPPRKNLIFYCLTTREIQSLIPRPPNFIQMSSLPGPLLYFIPLNLNLAGPSNIHMITMALIEKITMSKYLRINLIAAHSMNVCAPNRILLIDPRNSPGPISSIQSPASMIQLWFKYSAVLPFENGKPEEHDH